MLDKTKKIFNDEIKLEGARRFGVDSGSLSESESFEN